MIKHILPLVVLISVSACSSVTQPVNTITPSNISADNIQNKDISFSFKVTGNSVSRIKSVDAYLVTNPTNIGILPSGSYKTSVNVDNGLVNISFPNPPAGTYYVAVQAFDDVIANSTTRKNITKSNNAITSADKQFSVSSNYVTVSNGALTYSGGSAINLTINTVFNTLPVSISPEDGSPTPIQSITVEPIGNN